MESSINIESLKEWALAKLEAQNESMSVTEATLRFATTMLESLNDSGYLDEEGLTSSFLGLILGQLPWTTLAFAKPNSADTCYWSHYGKHGKGADTESRSGADFALVIRSDQDHVRVALFQAKKEKCQGHPGLIQVHQWPNTEDEHGNRRGQQFKVLFDKGREIQKKVSGGNPTIARLNWVYYLGMMKSGLRCKPLTKMHTSLRHVQKGKDTQDWVNMDASDTIGLIDLLTMENVDFSAAPYGWLPMTLVQAQTVLPSLLEFSDIFIIDERKGGPALELKLDGAVPGNMSFEAAPSEFKISPPSHKPIVALSRKPKF